MKTKKAVKSVDCEIKSPGVQAGAHTWMQKDLQKSGLSIENFTIEPLKREAELWERLGSAPISRTRILTVGGYWIPYPNAPGYYRLKLKTPIVTEKDTIKYLSPTKKMGFGNKPYILPEVKKLLEAYNPDKPIFITEGEKKAAKATLEEFPCIGLSGVWCFKGSENEFLPELDEYNWKDRSVYIVFDSDLSANPNVQLAERRLADQLNKRGAKVLFIRLPEEPNSDKKRA